MSMIQTASPFRAAGRAAPAPAMLAWAARIVAPVLQRRRNAKAAAWLANSPDYLLADIGIDRSAVDGIRRTGVPSGR